MTAIFNHLVELLDWYLFILISAPTAAGIAIFIQFIRNGDIDSNEFILITMLCLPAVMYFYSLMSANL